MPLPLPNLDDRDYDQLRSEALAFIRKNLDSDWNDLSPGDPGIVLLEAFAYLTEQMIYRLNRLPEKVYTAFLRLLGVNLTPPAAAAVWLRFSRDASGPAELIVPRATRIGLADADGRLDQPVFLTSKEVRLLAPGEGQELTLDVLAYQCELVEEELGISNNLPGQVFQVQQLPIAGRVKDSFDLVLGVEALPGERQPSDWLGSDNLYYHLWREVDNFFEPAGPNQVFTVDRQMGTIQFPPAVRKLKAKSTQQPARTRQGQRESGYRYLGEIPGNRRRIRIWYYRSLGAAGNLASGKLTRVLSADDHPALTALKVTNPKPAWGGMDGELLTDALIRGPYDVFSRQNVVTIRDYEAVARKFGRAIARAHAYALNDVWKHGRPGTVEIALVPALPDEKRANDLLANLLEEQTSNRHQVDFSAIQSALVERAPVGTRSQLTWARYKEVTVQASLVFADGILEPQAVCDTLAKRLYALITPLPAAAGGPETVGAAQAMGWPFGQELRVAQVYQTILAAEPRIKLIEQLELVVTSAPEKKINTLAADFFQPDTWYAGSGRSVFRSMNDGAGWEELLALQPNGAGELYYPRMKKDQRPERNFEQASVICPNPDRPGLVALATTLESCDTPEDQAPLICSALYLSADCGESWYCHTRNFHQEIRAMAWMLRASQPILLLATSNGLYELDIALSEGGQPDLKTETSSTYAIPHLVPVNPADQQMALNAVAVLRHRGNSIVAVAAQGRKGVFISRSDDLIPITDHLVTGNPPVVTTNFAQLPMTGDDKDPLDTVVDIRCLEVQTDLNHTYNFLWAGAMAVGSWAKGCYRWRFDQLVLNGQGEWISPAQWRGGSCHALAFVGPRVFAATDSAVVMAANFDPDHWDAQPGWQQLNPGQMMKTEWEGRVDGTGSASLKTQTYFDPIYALASVPAGEEDQPAVLMAGGQDGIFRMVLNSGKSEDAGNSNGDPAGAAGSDVFERVSRSRFRMMKDAVTAPFNWLLVSGTHAISPSKAVVVESRDKKLTAAE